VRTASDAADGIRALLADPPELILSDVSMPYLDGMELLRAPALDALTGIPVISSPDATMTIPWSVLRSWEWMIT